MGTAAAVRARTRAPPEAALSSNIGSCFRAVIAHLGNSSKDHPKRQSASVASA
jgi:hypothetical protein